MQKEGNSDLQTYIAYIIQRQKKLEAHGKAVPDDELISIFLKNLHPVFQPLQVQFAIPGVCPTKFEDVLAVVRRFSSSPVMAMELAKLKSNGMSQHMFPVTNILPNLSADSSLVADRSLRCKCSKLSSARIMPWPHSLIRL